MLEQIEKLLIELQEQQQKTLLKYAKTKVPQVTQDDLLQPNDYPELEYDPLFRFEEGVLIGIQSVIAAFRRQQKH